jgi:hypothetical protein
VWIATKVAEERYPVVKFAQVCVLPHRCFDDPVLDSDGDDEQLSASVLCVKVNIVPFELVLVHWLFNFLVQIWLCLQVFVGRDVHIVRQFVSIFDLVR